MTDIYISDAIHPDVLSEIKGLATVHYGYGPAKVNYMDVSPSIDAVILRTETFTRDMIAASPKLRIIARHGVGTDNVDLEAAAEHGVWVTSTPGANSNAVAEYVFALLLSALRKVDQAVDQVSRGVWAEARAGLVGSELMSKTIGVVGYGAIGRRVASIAQGFGMGVLVFDPVVSGEDVSSAGATLVEFDALLAEADVVTLHLPLLPSTRHIIGQREFSLMKETAFVVNASRGGLIDEVALLDALDSRALAGAALDVLDAENVSMKDPLAHNQLPVKILDKLIVTPHIAGQTIESLLKTGTMSWAEVKSVLAGEKPRHAVNLGKIPQVQI